MGKVKTIFVYAFILFFVGHIRGQELMVILTNENNNKEHIVKCKDKIMLDIKNKKGKLKEKQEVIVKAIDDENLYVLPDKRRFGEQAIHINEIKHIWIKTPGTRATGCLLFGLNLASGTSNVPTVYKKINLDKGKWDIKVKGER